MNENKWEYLLQKQKQKVYIKFLTIILWEIFLKATTASFAHYYN